MRTIQILLLFILITLLGAWPFLGTIALILAGIVAALLALGFVGYLADVSPAFRTTLTFAVSAVALLLFFGWLAFAREYISPAIEGTWIENAVMVLGAGFLAYIVFDGIHKLYRKYERGEIKS